MTSSAKKTKGSSSSRKGKKAPNKIPDLVLSHEKYGSRKLANFAAKLREQQQATELSQDFYKVLRKFESDLSEILGHLVEHGAVDPVGAVGKMLYEKVSHATLPAEATLCLVLCFDEAVVRSDPVRAVAWAASADTQGGEYIASRLDGLAPTLRNAFLLVRACRGAELDDATRAGAIAGLLTPLIFAKPAAIPGDGKLVILDDEALHTKLVELGGDDWFERTPLELQRRLPWSILQTPTRGKSLDDVLHLLGWLKDLEILEARSEGASAFFEAAEKVKPSLSTVIKIVGMSRAESPEEIPTGLEASMSPEVFKFRKEVGRQALVALGPERLDAWAAANAEEGDLLRALWLMGVPFGPAGMSVVLNPGPFGSSASAERWATDFHWEKPERDAVLGCLDVVAGAARSASGLDALALRRWAASLISMVPEDEAVPKGVEELLEPAAIQHVSYYKATIEALWRLPAERAEAVLRRSSDDFTSPPGEGDVTKEPYRELRFFRPRLSDRYIARVAGLIVEHQNDAMMWSTINHSPRGFKLEAMRLVEQIAAQLDGPPSASLSRDVEGFLGSEASGRLAELAGKSESPRDELRRVAASLEGSRVPIFILFPREEPAGPDAAAYTGGRPRGVAAEAVPRHRKRKLEHAFTVELSAAPELAGLYPEAAALSIFVQRYTEDVVRTQALLPLTKEQLAAEPGELEQARLVEIERVEVPVAIFDEEPAAPILHLQDLVYRQAGYLMGGPLWLQDGPAGVDQRFVAQFDERLATGVNLGDSGIAYCFTHECVWQCH